MSNPYPPGTYPAKLYDSIHGADVVAAPGGNAWQKYIPSGTIDGVNTIFTVPSVPVVSNFQLFFNGILQSDSGDYVLVGSTITMTLAPKVGDSLVAYF